MKFIPAVIALLALSPALAEDAPSRIDSITKSARDLMPAMPTLSLPAMPDFSMPDFAGMGNSVMNEFNVFTQQVSDTLPLLEEMGFEVTTFRVQWGLPPKAKLRLRSPATLESAKIDAIAARAPSGALVGALVSSAATAKKIQRSMKMGTAILDVDFALPPKVRMSFLSTKASKDAESERHVEDLDLACNQAFTAN